MDQRRRMVVYSAYTPALGGIYVTLTCGQTHLMLHHIWASPDPPTQLLGTSLAYWVEHGNYIWNHGENMDCNSDESITMNPTTNCKRKWIYCYR